VANPAFVTINIYFDDIEELEQSEYHKLLRDAKEIIDDLVKKGYRLLDNAGLYGLWQATRVMDKSRMVTAGYVFQKRLTGSQLSKVDRLMGGISSELARRVSVLKRSITSSKGESGMDRTAKIAERIAADRLMMAATKNLSELTAIAPEWYKKRAEFMEEQEAAQQEFNRKWAEAHADLEKGTTELLAEIKSELVKYFKQSGKDVRHADSTGGLVEVFLGSKDGVKRTQSKVSVHISLTFENDVTTTWMLRNEQLDDRQGLLSPTGTISKLMAEVRRADKTGFWDEGEIE
jgi:hypothetical protein